MDWGDDLDLELALQDEVELTGLATWESEGSLLLRLSRFRTGCVLQEMRDPNGKQSSWTSVQVGPFQADCTTTSTPDLLSLSRQCNLISSGSKDLLGVGLGIGSSQHKHGSLMPGHCSAFAVAEHKRQRLLQPADEEDDDDIEELLRLASSQVGRHKVVQSMPAQSTARAQPKVCPGAACCSTGQEFSRLQWSAPVLPLHTYASCFILEQSLAGCPRPKRHMGVHGIHHHDQEAGPLRRGKSC